MTLGYASLGGAKRFAAWLLYPKRFTRSLAEFIDEILRSQIQVVTP
jgi:hypothetical protein